MTLNQIFNDFPKIFKIFKNKDGVKKVLNLKHLIYFLAIILLFGIFIIILNLVNHQNKIENQNLNSVVKSEEFLNLSEYLVSKINSPYKEIKYLIKKMTQ